MNFSSKFVRFTSLLVVAGLVSATTVPTKKADAAVGVIVALTSKSPSVQNIGWLLAGVGGLTTIVGLVANTNQTQCTPSRPCSCTTTDPNDQSCQAQGVQSYNTTCVTDEYETDCESDPTFYGDRYNGTQGNSAANGTIVTIGLVLLGTDAKPAVTFHALNAKSAQELNIAPKQMDAFNHELTKINLIANTFLAQIAQESAQGKKSAQIQSDSKALWDSQAKPVLSADAFAALQVASASYLKSIMDQIAATK